MDTNAADRLKRGALDLGLDLNDSQVHQFIRYAELLAEWNARMNLTRVPPEEVVPLHFLDSLLVCKAMDLPERASLIDVGTGAGFPGLPLKIISPLVSATLLDSTRKRLAFLDEVIADLGIQTVHTLHGRAEDAGRDPSQRERYDVATARAVARLNTLAEWLLPFVRVGGVAVALKSAGADEEIEESATAVSRLGGRIERVVAVTIPGAGIERKIVVIRKDRRTPEKYPRTAAEIKARPLA